MRRGLIALLEALRPSLLGAAYLLAVTGASAWRAASDDRVSGVEASHVTEAIRVHFGHHVSDAAWLLGAVAAAAGLLLGVASSLLVRLRAWLAGSPVPRAPRLQAEALLVIFGLHGSAVLLGVARRPQLYEDFFYAQGGLRRLVQVTCTDVLGPTGVGLLVALALGTYLLGSPRRWPALARRLSRSLGRPGAAAGALGLLLAAGASLSPRWPEARAQAPSPPAPPAVAPPAVAPPAVAPPAASAAEPKASTSGPGPAPEGGKKHPQGVVILAADSLRADRLRPSTAPALSAFAEQAVRFERAYVSLPRTFPSWVTLLTGRYPHRHGIRNMFPSRQARTRNFDTVPKRLREAGYTTAVVSDYAGDIFPRIELGFETIEAPTFHLGELVRQRAIEAQPGLLPFLDTSAGRALVPSMWGLNRAPDAAGVARRALEFIDRSRGRPFFLVVFFSTAHFPYASPSPGYGRFTDLSYRGRFKYQKVNALGREAPPDEADQQQIRALYDGAVTTVDEAMGEVLRGLRVRGLDESTVVVVTADHGETLFENGRGHGHGDHLFSDEALSVPLLVRDGRRPSPRRVEGIARDVDLAPTLYELTGVAPPGDLDGTSLGPALAGAPLTTAAAFAETGLWFTEEVQGVPTELRLPYPDISRMGEIVRDAGDDVVLQGAYFPLTVMAKHRAITTRDHRLIVAPTRQGLRTMLYDLRRDPACLDDRAAAEPETAAKLRAALIDWILQDPSIELRGEHLVPRAGAVSAERGVAGEAFRLEGP